MGNPVMARKLIIIWCVLLIAALLLTGGFLLVKNLAVSNMEAYLVKIYDGPVPLKAAEGMKMYVNDHELFVYPLPVNNTHTWVGTGDPPVDYSSMAYYD